MLYENIKRQDPEIYDAIMCELHRQQDKIELIASENFVSPAVLEANGSVLTNKYAEGYPGKRYYGGCECVDIVEELAIERVKKIFNAAYANVQPHSGASANTAVLFALVKQGSKILGMDLAHGGHLTHGMKINFSGKYFEAHGYKVDRETMMLDYEAIREQAKEVKPAIIIAGGSAYPRKIDFAKFREIADEVGALLWVDMAHIAGLVAAGLHMNPVEYADVVTSTTHKTLRGSRGGIILTNNETYAKKLNSAIFPGTQGGPLMHIIAGKAVSFGEALKPEFKEYQKNVIENARALAESLMKRNVELCTNGTDTHLLLLDLRKSGVTGKDLQERLDEVNITTNKNGIPYDELKPTITSGLRLGTPAVTTRGMNTADMDVIGELIADSIFRFDEKEEEIQARVAELLGRYPLYESMK